MDISHSECMLTEDDTLMKHVIDSGICIDMRRKLCGLFMINPNHPTTRVYFKSNYSIKIEAAIHLVNHTNMIHPYSMFNLYWEFIILWLFIFMVIVHVLTCTYMFNVEMRGVISYLEFFGNMVFLIDIAHFFFTGYYSGEEGKTVLNPKMVARNYLLSYFIVDLLPIGASLPFPLVLSGFITNEATHPVIRWTRFLGAIRIFRIPRFSMVLDLYREYKYSSKYIMKYINFIASYLLIIIFIYTLLFAIRENSNWFPIDTIKDFFFSMQIILGIGNAGKTKDEEFTLIIVTLFLLIGYSTHMFLYTQVYQILQMFNIARGKNKMLWEYIKQYMNYEGLPENIRKKLCVFYNFKYMNEFYNERKINNTVSNILKEEILLSITKNIIKSVKIFKPIPQKIMIQIIRNLKSEVYLEDDIIITAGQTYSHMYLIHYGTVAVYNKGKEICHLRDGDTFGQMGMIFELKGAYDIVAVSACDIYKLKRSDFFDVLDAKIRSEILTIANDMLNDHRII